MSSAYAIAAVTALLVDVLHDAVTNAWPDTSADPLDPTDLPAEKVEVTALPPNRVQTDDQEQDQLNIFCTRHCQIAAGAT